MQSHSWGKVISKTCFKLRVSHASYQSSSFCSANWASEWTHHDIHILVRSRSYQIRKERKTKKKKKGICLDQLTNWSSCSSPFLISNKRSTYIVLGHEFQGGKDTQKSHNKLVYALWSHIAKAKRGWQGKMQQSGEQKKAGRWRLYRGFFSCLLNLRIALCIPIPKLFLEGSEVGGLRRVTGVKDG